MTDHPSVVEQIARAVLYEGHMLYPYRRSALKNRRPWSFGTLAPRDWVAATQADPFCFRAECLAHTSPRARLTVTLRFLHLSREELANPANTLPIQFGEAAERSIVVSLDVPLDVTSRDDAVEARSAFVIPPSDDRERRLTWLGLSGELRVCAEPITEGAVKLSVFASNTTPLDANADRDEALLDSLVAAHAALELSGGEFVSLLDPPPQFADAVAQCRSEGVYPVLVGSPEHRDQMLASPIILYDYPEVAPESPGDFFDATEMDEMLALRVLTLTDAEKQEMRNSGAQARAILDRTEAMPPEQLRKVHGALRGLRRVENNR